VIELLLLLVVALVILWLTRTFVGQAFSIPSQSMEPQLRLDDRMLVSKLAYDLHDPRRGDIVVFDAPKGAPNRADRASAPVRLLRRLFLPSAREYVKRVLALPGERVEARGGHVLVNGNVLIEPYLPPGTVTDDFEARVVPEGRLWVMGDNRAASPDSRDFGPIRRSSVVGRAVLRVWPVQRISFL
jgi:signal peptidase I